MTTVTSQPLQHTYFVRDIATALLTYNRLRWHRSEDGPNGTYEARTQPAPTAAVLDSGLVEPHQLNGKELKFRVNGVTEVSVVVAAADPVSNSDLITEIGGATPLVVPSDVSGVLRLTSVLTGTGASIEILDGDANPFIGWTEGQGATGQDSDTVLVAGTHEYFFTDQNSHRDYWYKVEFLHSVTAVTTGLGVAFPANQADSVPKSQTIVAHLRLADMSGCPIEGRLVTLHNVFIPDLASGFGIFRHSTTLTTDRNGYAETRLIRGMTVDMSIDGTGFVRRLTVPTTGDIVDLLDPSLVAEDEFGVQEADIDFAIRTS
jgi:hypothetical protein